MDQYAKLNFDAADVLPLLQHVNVSVVLPRRVCFSIFPDVDLNVMLQKVWKHHCIATYTAIRDCKEALKAINFRDAILYTGITGNDEYFFLPVFIPTDEDQVKEYQQLQEIITIAKTSAWIFLSENANLSEYKTVSFTIYQPPVFTVNQKYLLQKAFENKVCDKSYFRQYSND